MTQKLIYAFWTGDNEMSHDRRACMTSLLEKSGVDVLLVTPDNLKENILSNYPLHPAYEYLSLTHRADYLRCYFMHHLGGGYSDIKKTSASWRKSFEDLDASDSSYVNGYPELNADCVAMVGGDLYLALRANYQKVVGCSAFMCKSNTPFTEEWYNSVNNILDILMPYLVESPAKHPQEKFGMIIDGRPSKYPLRWTEILGNVFHPLCLKYSDNIIQTLPRCEFDQPYR